MELNRQAQKKSIKYREQLIKELEEAKELTRREKEQEELKAAGRQELEAQVQHTFQIRAQLLKVPNLALTASSSLCPADTVPLARTGRAAAPEGGGRGEISPAALQGIGAAGGRVCG